jgi:type IV pilus assembly protein PilM
MLERFLANRPRKFLSIDFGQRTIKLLYLERIAGGLRLLDYAIQAMPLERVQQDDFIVGTIKEFLRQAAATSRQALLSISERDNVAVKCLSLPDIPEEEVLAAAKWQLKEEIPFNLEEAVFNWQQLGRYSNAQGIKEKDFLFAVAQRQSVERYLSLASRAGLNVFKLTSDSLNYAHFFSLLGGMAEAAAVLDIGYKYSVLGLYRGSQLYFTRRLSFSSEKLQQSLREVLFSPQGKIELTSEQAEKLKNDFGIPAEDAGVLEGLISASQALALMRPALEALVRDIKLSLDYFSSNLNSRRPSQLYLTGGEAKLKNLDSYLKKELGLEVNCFELPAALQVVPRLKEQLERDKNQLAAALAAALGASNRINLLPAEVLNRKLNSLQCAFLRVTSVTLTAVLLFLFFVVRLRMRDYSLRLKHAQMHLGALAGSKLLKEKIDQRQQLAQLIRAQEMPADGLLKIVSAVIPANIVLEELYFNQAGHSLSLKGAVLAGESATESLLTDFMRKLEATAHIKEAVLVSSSSSGPAQKFEIRCDLVY